MMMVLRKYFFLVCNLVFTLSQEDVVKVNKCCNFDEVYDTASRQCKEGSKHS